MVAMPVADSVALFDYDVTDWRFSCLAQAGYPIPDALELAQRKDVDLHQACELLLRGASLEQALRILR